MPQTMVELAQSGTVFDSNFVTTSLCCPSRSSLFTGEYAHNTGVLRNDGPDGGFEAFDDRSTLATWLNSAGYDTALFGKYLNGYDLSAPQNQNPNDTYIPPGWDEWHAFLGAGYFNTKISDNGVEHQYPDYSTDVLADQAVNFIHAAESNDNQPFFIYYAPHAPHSPANPAQRNKGQFDDLPPFRPPSFNEADVSDKPTWDRTLPPLSAQDIAGIDQLRKNQLESLQAVDDAVGSFMDALRETGELSRTVVIYTSDNGLLWGEHRYQFKASAFEESIRVPLIIRDGRDPVARTTDKMSLNIDLAPTIAQMAGIAVPGTVDGMSLAPLVHGQAVNWRTDFLVEHFTGERPGEHSAIRTTRYTYVEYKNGDRELYDLQNDPFELRNIVNDPANADLVKQLSARLQQLKVQHGNITTNYLYFSTTAGGALAGSSTPAINFTDADILELAIQSDGAYRYNTYFDGSDVGLTTATEDVDAFDIQTDGSIILSTVGAFSVRATHNAAGVASGATLTGGGEDLLRFTPSSLGSVTAGTWSIFFDGSTKGLTGAAENIDAVSVLPDGRLLISTSGAATVPGVASAADEDLLSYNRSTNTWSLYFDGSDVGLTTNDAEDIDALYFENGGAANPTLFFSTRGAFAVPGASGQNEDMVWFNPTSLGANTAGSFVSPLAFDGSRFGLAGFDIDGFSRGRAPRPGGATPDIAVASQSIAPSGSPPAVPAGDDELLGVTLAAAPPLPELAATAKSSALSNTSPEASKRTEPLAAALWHEEAMLRRIVSGRRLLTVRDSGVPAAVDRVLQNWQLDG